MSERNLEIRVGLLIAAALVVLGGFIITLGTFRIGDGYTLFVDYDFSGNIRSGAPVRVSGVDVGRVDDVEFIGGRVDPDTGRRVQVRLEVWLEDRTRETIRQDAEFFVNTAGVLGEQYLEIVPGQDYDNPPIEPDTIVRGVDPPRTDLVIARLYDVLDQVAALLTEEGDMIARLFEDSAASVEAVRGIVEDNQDEIGELIVSADRAAGEGADFLSEVNRRDGGAAAVTTLRRAEGLLGRADQSLDEVVPPLRDFLVDAERVTNLATEERVERALSAADEAAGAAGKAGGLLDRVDAIVRRVARGEGTAGALLVREEMYADLRELLRDLKRNPWKLFWKE